MNTVLSSSYSVDLVSEMPRFERWAGIVSRVLNPVELDSSEREHFDARASTFQLGGVACLFSQGASPVVVHGTCQHAAEATGHSYQVVVMRHSGNGVLQQGHQETHFGARDLVLFSTTQDMVVKVPDANFTCLSIPDAVVRLWRPEPHGHGARVLPGDKGWAAVLSSYLNHLKPEVIAATAPGQHLQMFEHVLSIYAFALQESGPALPADAHISSHNKADLFARMHNWLAEHYMDPEISATHIAQHFGISVREVHRRFSRARQGSTFLDALRELRMTAAIRMLTDSHFSSLTVAEIGYRSGFSEPAYFGRVFRQRLGCSPGAFAKARMKDGLAERVAA